jgi:Type I restriction-modification system methyltransferase subunit
MDAAEYKHVVLGLIFLKYISDSFTELYNELLSNPEADPEDLDEYKSKNIFYVPKKPDGITCRIMRNSRI